MRKFLLAAITLMLISPAGAATVGCPVNFPDEGGIIAGIEINEFSSYRFSEKDEFGAGFVDCASSQYVAKIQYGVNNWVAVTGKAGTADLRLSDPAHTLTPASKMDFTKGAIYGAGAKMVVYENPQRAMRLVLSSEYLISSPGDMRNGAEYTAKWKEWDNALMAVFTRQNVDPDEMFTGTSFYLGGKYSQPEIEWTEQTAEDGKIEARTLTADDNINFFAGFDVVFDTYAILSFEARIGNIDSYTVAFAYRF